MNKTNNKINKNPIELIKKIFKFLFKTKTRGLIVLIGLLVLLFVANNTYKSLTTALEDTLNIYVAEMSDLKNTVSETGIVKIADETGLSFKYGGIINNIYVQIGEKVTRGDSLARVESGEFNAQYQQTEASVKSAQAQLDQLIAGATQSDINLAKARVESAKVNLKNKEISLDNIRLDADLDIESAYQDSVEALNSAYLNIYNTYIDADLIERTYFGNFDQESVTVRSAISRLEVTKNSANDLISNAVMDSDYLNINTSLSEIKNLLIDTYSDLVIIRDIMENNSYTATISSTNKTLIDTAKTTINTARTTMTNTIQTIASTKVTNITNISSAEALIRSAERSLDEINKSLEKLLAGPTPENISIYEARVAQTKAERSMLVNKLSTSIIRAPSDGQVVRIEKRIGEAVGGAQTVISFLPEKPFQIETEIYEEDVTILKIGNPVEISLVAFPDEIVMGTVSSIDPVEIIINGVVYYKVSIDFDNEIDELKSGMTADISIVTSEEKNVLIVPESALLKNNGNYLIKVLEKNEVKEYETEIGMRGDEGMVEILSGINDGDKIVLP